MPAGRSTPPSVVGWVVMRRQEIWLDSKRSVSSTAAAASDGSAHSASHWSRRGSRQRNVLHSSAVTGSWPANEIPYTTDSTSR